MTCLRGGVDEAGNYSAPSAPIALTIDTSVASLQMVRIAPSTAAEDSGLYPNDGIYNTLRPTLRAYLPDKVAEGDRLEVYYRHPASDAPRASHLVDNPLLTQIDIERGYVDVTPAEDMSKRRTFDGTSIKFGSWQYAFFGRVVDQAGNASSIRDPGAAEPYAYVDVEGPQAASGLGLMDQDDTGVASDDNITALQTGFTLTTGRLGTWVTKVDFYANGALLGTAAPNDNRYAKFTYDGPELDAGVYWITAVTHRSSGVPTAPTEQFELIIDPTEKSPVPQFGKLQLKAGDDTGLSQNDGITKSGRVYIEGVLTPGQTVMVFNDVDGDGQYTVGERVATTTSDATTGAFSVRLYLSTGTNVLRAVTVPSSDLADPVASEPFTVIRRGIPASEPISISLLASSDTTVFNAEDGISGGSFLTAESRPELRLTLPGEMQAGDLVQLFNGNTKIYSLLADEDAIAAGFMDVRLPEGGELADGSHNLSMKVADAAGNTSRSSPSIKVTVDTVGPEAPTNLGLAPGNDTGGLDDDGFTGRDTHLTLQGTYPGDAEALNIYRTSADPRLREGFAFVADDFGVGAITTGVGGDLLEGMNALDSASITLTGGTLNGTGLGGPLPATAFRYGDSDSRWLIAAYDGAADKTRLVQLLVDVRSDGETYARSLDAVDAEGNQVQSKAAVNAAWANGDRSAKVTGRDDRDD
jgi:hypothetical protein